MKKMKLDNGLRIILKKRSFSKTVSIAAAVKVGSVNESVKDSGISHLTEHLLFNGLKKQGKGKGRTYDSIIESIGGHFDGLTQQDFTKFNINILSEHAEIALEVMQEMIFNPSFNDTSLKKEKKVVSEEINQLFDSPHNLAWLCFLKELYGDHPYSRNILGTKESIYHIKKNDLMKFHKYYYAPSNVVISVVGNFDKQKLKPKIKDLFSEPLLHKVHSIVPQPKINVAGKLTTVQKKGLVQTYLTVGGAAPKIDDKRKYAMEAMINILSGKRTSHLFKTLIKKFGLIYDYYSKYEPLVGGYYYLCFVASPKNYFKVKKLVDTTIKEFVKRGVSESELSNTKNYLKYVNALMKESNQRLADSYAIKELFTKAKEVEMYDKNINSLTTQEVNDVARSFLNPKNIISVIIKPT